MKRRQLVFVSAVFSAVLTGFVLERQRDDDPSAYISITAPSRVELPPVDLPAANESLEGFVLDENGTGLADVGVHLFRAERATPTGDPDLGAEPLPWTRTGRDGRFRLEGAPAGPFRVAILAPGRPLGEQDVTLPAGGPVRWQVEAPLEAPTPLPELVTNVLVGRIAPPVGTLPEPYPVADYEVWLEPLGEEEGWLTGAVPRRVTVDPSGGFRIENLVAGRYIVRLLPPWGAGGRWPILEEIAYTLPAPPSSDEPQEPAQLGLRLRSGTLGGRVYDDESSPLEGALVKVWPEGQPERLWPTTGTDAKGEFLVRDLPPGRYRVRLRAGAAEHEEDVTIRIGARTTLTPPQLAPKNER